MVVNEKLADKLREALADQNVDVKSMFGGLTFMVNGKMCVGNMGDDLMVRVDLKPDSEVAYERQVV